MRRNYKSDLFLLLFVLLGTIELWSSCNAPFNPSFSNITTSSADLSWIDVNGSDALGWEIELVSAGQSPTGTPTTDTILTKSYQFTGLNHSNVYTIYLRTICDKGETDWNGPFTFYTHLQNQDACNIAIGIDDNDCSDFFIDVAGVNPSSLGEDIFIEEVNLSIDHTWPRDLKIELTSPNGKTVLLSAYHGNSTDHYGDPSDPLCSSTASFNNEACQGIEEVEPPFVGTFKAEGDINLFLDGSDPNGTWTLNICDRADEHVGVLTFIEIKFSQEVCPIPSEIVVRNIDATQAEIKWTPPFNCGFLRIEWGLEGFATGTANSFFVNCQSGLFTIGDLLPNTTYDIYLRAQCSQINSPFSCGIRFTTSCINSTARESFDILEVCEQLCDSPCAISGNWSNSTSDDHDWIVNSGTTPSSFTGPARDPFLCGNYIYIENTPSICNAGAEAILLSNCMQLDLSTDACVDFSFMYHMYGFEANELKLEISEDSGENWASLFSVSGDQGDLWHTQIIDLSAYYGKQVKFRFTGISGGTEGDIAIDQIQFFGGTFLQNDVTYFIDNDLDGYGSADSILYCGVPLASYSLVSGDCDDTDASIHPAALELPCNLIDENCNGNDDDPIQINPVSYTITVQEDESCAGVLDGQISIVLDNGTPPYDILWNNGDVGAGITNLSKGVYYATITDGTGCKLQTEFIELDASTSLQLFTARADSPTCAGIDDGMIAVDVIGGSGPYTFLWDDTSTDSIAINLPGGDHYVTVTDSNGCFIESDAIKLITPTVINAGVQFKTDISCNGGSNGGIQIGIIQGDGPFDFKWESGESIATINGLSAGTYTCTVSDKNGCYEVISDIEVSEPEAISLFIEDAENVRCAGDDNGRIEMKVSGGTSPYSFLWSNGSFSEDLFNLSEGDYIVTITDSKGCQLIGDTISISSPAPLEVGLNTITHVDCPFSQSGAIDLSITGGTPEYNFFWDQTLADTSYLEALSPGTYNLTILDRFECKTSPPGIAINALNLPLAVDMEIVQENACFGDSTGMIISTVDSDRWPLDYNWNSGVQDISSIPIDTLDLLPNGSYNVTITDSEGCVGSSELIEISSPDRLSYYVSQAVDLLCYEDQNGILEIEVDGGLTPYDIQWNTGQTDTLLTDLAAGTYSFSLYDDNGCKLIGNPIEITQAEKIIITADIKDVSNGSNDGRISVDVNGGTPFYFYTWSSNANTLNESVATNLASDTYLLSIIDANSCKIDTSFFVDNISGINDLELNKIRILQNPIDNQLVLRLPSDSWNYQIISVHGKKIKTGNSLGSVVHLDVSHFPDGNYYIRLIKNKIYTTLPFIVIH